MIKPSKLSAEPQLMPRVDSEDSKPTEPVSTTGQGSRFRWLVAPENPKALLPIAGLWIISLDWLLFGSNVLSAGMGTPVIVVLGFLLGSTGTYFFQRHFARDAPWKAFLKGAIAGVCVGMPWPVGGTLIGGWVLLYSGLGRGTSRKGTSRKGTSRKGTSRKATSRKATPKGRT